ncbi:DNA replication/repair protein RecF [Endozoicomonas sp. (ex Bugula neritina AB1)]|nr:DNA replication/repair protein RecF [Endozoicomonas sp. (ex Bugula neritina AB1)]
MIQKLTITDVRNLASISFHPSPSINVLYGLNGSGKTSILEAIHLLGLARSFRSSRLRPVINRESDKCTVFGRLETQDLGIVPVGVARDVKGETALIRVGGESLRSTSDLAKLLPLQVINPDTFRLLEGSPKLRRHFIDWGVFHVKHGDFIPLWKRMQKALKQRNSLLRHGRINGSELPAWDHEFVKASEAVDKLRQEYLKQLIPMFHDVLSQLTDLTDVSISYYRGWDRDRRLADVLQAGVQRDAQTGYTHSGPQRADLRIKLGKVNAVDILSRGQLKLVVCALKLAQGFLYSELSGKKCIFLVDDLPSELDSPHRRALCRLLLKMGCQTFITCVEHIALENCWLPEAEVKLFHVKQGTIQLDEEPQEDIRQVESLEIEHE